MKKILSTAGVVGSLYLVPLLAFAQAGVTPSLGGFSGLGTVIATFINNTLVPLVFAVAFLVFIYGVFKYFILGGGDESKRSEGKSLMLYAIIGFVLMVSIWGIVNFVAANFGWRTNDVGTIPDVPLPGANP